MQRKISPGHGEDRPDLPTVEHRKPEVSLWKCDRTWESRFDLDVVSSTESTGVDR